MVVWAGHRQITNRSSGDHLVVIDALDGVITADRRLLWRRRRRSDDGAACTADAA